MSKHPVPVDETAIYAVFDRYITDPSPLEGQYLPHDRPGDEPPPQYDPQAWEVEASFFAAILCDGLLQQWGIPDETQAKLGAGMAAAIRSKFPISIGSTMKEKVRNMGPWGQLGEALAETAQHGVIMDGFIPRGLKPLGPAPETPAQEQDEDSPGATTAPPRKSSGPFTTEGEKSDND